MELRKAIFVSFVVMSLVITTPGFSENLPASSSPTPAGAVAAADPLLQLLVSKGVLNAEEAKSLTGTPEEQRTRLLELLREKGILSAQDVEALAPASAQVASNLVASTMPILPGSALVQSAAPKDAPAASPGPTVITAAMPIRPMPIDVQKQGGMIPDLKLGSGASMKIYGFFKASAVSDTASSGGPTFGSQDFPLPLLLADTGPTSDPQVHLKARSFRIGSQVEWVPKNSDFTVTGRLETDYEGDYTDVNNRNIGGARSSQLSLRLAYVRLDHKIGDANWFAEFGQDWTLLGSSTLPNIFESTGTAIGMGGFWERSPQFRTGFQFHSGDFKIQPEFAILMPVEGSSALTEDQRTRFGDRAGAEANQPALESRVVFQLPLNKNWRGVAPAQFIVSGHHARMNEIIPHAGQAPTTCTVLPCTPFTSATVPNIGFTTTTTILNAPNCPEGASCNLEQFYPTGSQAGDPQNAYSLEFQLPTPWVTWTTKYYRGNNLRFFFAGQLNDVWSNLNGLFNVGNGISYSGRSILFGCADGTTAGQPAATIDCQGSNVESSTLSPFAGGGGFTEFTFPLSRIFHANPEGHNSGWLLHVMYGTDRAKYSDAQHGNHLGRTDLDTMNLVYRLNKWVTFTHEVSYIATFTANDHAADGTITRHPLLFAGRNVYQAHNWRNEFGPIFTF